MPVRHVVLIKRPFEFYIIAIIHLHVLFLTNGTGEKMFTLRNDLFGPAIEWIRCVVFSFP